MSTGNSAYATTDFTAFAIEQVLKRDWAFQWTFASPLLACIKDSGLRWNKGFKVLGLKGLIPIAMDDMTDPPAGVADANELTADTPRVTNGFSGAAYDYCHIRRGFTIRSSENMLAINGARGNLLDGKVKQLMASFRNVAANMIAGSANASRTSLIGLQYLLNTANSPGGISQATDTWWQAQTTASIGNINLPTINNAYDSITRFAGESGDPDAPDLLILSSLGSGGSNPNVYGRFRELIAPAERIVNAEFQAKYGFSNFTYMNMKCVQSHREASGTVYMLTTKTFYYGGFDRPQALQTIRLPGTDSEERYYNMWSFVGCDEIRRNWKGTGAT